MSPFRRRGSENERRGTPSQFVVLGLGNPGRDYEGTRHNVGAETVELLAERHDGRLKTVKRQPFRAGEVVLGGRRIALVVPTVYMNESGLAASAAVRRFGVDEIDRLVVVHDELDLPVGRLRVKAGGGLAGHNGLRSLQQHLKSTDFIRVRIGVGKPPSAEQGADHVLRRPGRGDRKQLDAIVEAAADAVESIVADGIDVTMNRFN